MTKQIALATVVCALVAVGTASFAQGLGEASKKEKQRRQTSTSTSTPKTYTAEDLEELEPIANEGDAERPVASRADRSSIRPSTNRGRRSSESRGADEESQWRARVAQAQARVDEERAVYEHWAGLSLVPGYELVDNRGRSVAGSVEELQARTARAKARLEAAEKALDDLHEEARRKGVPPGWLR